MSISVSDVRRVRRYLHASEVRVDSIMANALSRAERRVNFTVIDQRDEEIAQRVLPEIAAIMARAAKRVLGTDAELATLIDDDPTDIATISLSGSDVARVRTLMEQAMAASWQLGSVTAGNELAQAGIIQHQKLTYASLRGRASAYLEANGFRMAENVSEATRSIIQQELLTGIRSGKSVSTVRIAIWDRLVRRGITSREAVLGIESDSAIVAALDALWVDDESMAAHYLETLVRTNMFEAMNEGRFAEFNDPVTGAGIIALEYSAILDERTTELCKHLHGRIYRKDSPVWDMWRPPNHYNCRSVIIPITVNDGWNGVESTQPRMEPMAGFFAADHAERFAWNPLQERWPVGTPVAGAEGGGRWRKADSGEAAHQEAARVSKKQTRVYDKVPDYGKQQVKGLTEAENDVLHSYRQDSEFINTPLRKGKDPASIKDKRNDLSYADRLHEIIRGRDDFEDVFKAAEFKSESAYREARKLVDKAVNLEDLAVSAYLSLNKASIKEFAGIEAKYKQAKQAASKAYDVAKSFLKSNVAPIPFVGTLDSALSKAKFPHDAVLFRGLYGSHDVWKGNNLRIKEGSMIRDRGYQSWSVDVSAATGFTSRFRPTYFVTGVSKGDRAIALRHSSSAHNGEREVLLPRDRQYRVAKIVGGEEKPVKPTGSRITIRQPTYIFLEEVKTKGRK